MNTTVRPSWRCKATVKVFGRDIDAGPVEVVRCEGGPEDAAVLTNGRVVCRACGEMDREGGR